MSEKITFLYSKIKNIQKNIFLPTFSVWYSFLVTPRAVLNNRKRNSFVDILGSFKAGKAIYPRIRKSRRSRSVSISRIGFEGREMRKGQSEVLVASFLPKATRLCRVTRHGRALVRVRRTLYRGERERQRDDESSRTEGKWEGWRGAKAPALWTDADVGPNRNIDSRVNAPLSLSLATIRCTWRVILLEERRRGEAQQSLLAFFKRGTFSTLVFRTLFSSFMLPF